MWKTCFFHQFICEERKLLFFLLQFTHFIKRLLSLALQRVDEAIRTLITIFSIRVQTNFDDKIVKSANKMLNKTIKSFVIITETEERGREKAVTKVHQIEGTKNADVRKFKNSVCIIKHCWSCYLSMNFQQRTQAEFIVDK